MHNSIVRISLDGGQDFLKIIVNVFDPAEKHLTSAPAKLYIQAKM